MTDFDQLLRIAEGFYNIQLKMLGATLKQAKGVQAFWIGVFRYMNEVTRPFLVFQTGFEQRKKQSVTTVVGGRSSPHEKASLVSSKTAAVSEEHSPGPEGHGVEAKTPEPTMTPDVVTRRRTGRKPKVPVPIAAPDVAPLPEEVVVPAAPLPFTPGEEPRKPTPARRTKPTKARSNVASSGKNHSLSLKRFSKVRITGKKVRSR